MRRAFPGVHYYERIRGKGPKKGEGITDQKVGKVGGFWPVVNCIEYCRVDFGLFGGGYCVRCWVLRSHFGFKYEVEFRWWRKLNLRKVGVSCDSFVKKAATIA